MNCVKADWHSSLSRDRLVLLKISEDGPSLEELTPDASIDCWNSDKVNRLNTGPHNYPSKQKKSSDSKVIELETLTLSDLKNNESNRCRFRFKNRVFWSTNKSIQMECSLNFVFFCFCLFLYFHTFFQEIEDRISNKMPH